jgi:pimeloyl-ACP methyl ester carboxylesterase
MIEEALGAIDYDERGSGPTLVLVAGSCSTGAAWRPVVAAWDNRYRCITTSLLGYGGTSERRTEADTAISHEADILESVIRRAGTPVHLVGHSFGGLIAVAVALRKHVPLTSLTILEAPAMELLRNRGEDDHYGQFRAMTDRYFAAFHAGDAEAIGMMIDFYGGQGTFASWPPRVRAYAADTTAVNLRDWQSAFGFPLSPEVLGSVHVPSLVAWGGASHPAARRANALLGASLHNARSIEIAGAAHFMISTHPTVVAELVESQVQEAEKRRGA